MPVIPALERSKPEECKFEDCMGLYSKDPVSNKQTNVTVNSQAAFVCLGLSPRLSGSVGWT